MRPPNTGGRGLGWNVIALTFVVLVVAALVAVVNKWQSTPAAELQPQPRVEMPAPEPTPKELEQARLAKVRLSIAVQLRQTLNDAGYDITVGEVGPTLLLHGDVYKDTTTRVESLEMLRSIANDRLCPWGFRQVNIGAGLFSGSDYTYPLHCAGQE
jgi:hypothetical protein